MAVKVRALQVKTRRDVAHEAGMTVRRVLENARVAVPHGATVTLDGKPTTLEAPVPDGTMVVVTPPVVNG